ncbi:MAG: magnesium chelatase, partial [Acidobacteria bacterium]|nr:magnesium chelatase [Acidobacteriota bacterium]
MQRPTVLSDLRRAVDAGRIPRRTVRQELRDNLIDKLRRGDTLFPGIIGYDDSVIPQIGNAILSRHDLIILGLRGQAKTRILRALADLLDHELPVVAGCEINDDPHEPLCPACRARAREEGDGLPVAWLPRSRRLGEKLATPDVTIADMIGDIDPIKAARRGLQLSDDLTEHYGLLPRANRGIFAVNELPDLAGKIQVGLFNILQEGDVQIKGYPVRLPLDVMMAFTANPEDYTARGKIVTPLKDRIGSEIRTHYPRTRHDAIAITRQEAWIGRGGDAADDDVTVPPFVRETVEEIAFQARADKRIDRRSGVSQRLPITCLENVVSNAERRALATDERPAVARITDIYAALPSITGKLELEYEGELKGADQVALDLIRTAVRRAFDGWFDGMDTATVVEWFEMGGTLTAGDATSAAELVQEVSEIQGLDELLERA